jgi:hypothetical protein
MRRQANGPTKMQGELLIPHAVQLFGSNGAAETSSSGDTHLVLKINPTISSLQSAWIRPYPPILGAGG